MGLSRNGSRIPGFCQVWCGAVFSPNGSGGIKIVNVSNVGATCHRGFGNKTPEEAGRV